MKVRSAVGPQLGQDITGIQRIHIVELLQGPQWGLKAWQGANALKTICERVNRYSLPQWCGSKLFFSDLDSDPDCL
jgi:hypothetical protein